MGTLTLTLPDGRTGSLQVDDGFASLSDAQKADFLDHVRGQLEPHQSFSADIKGGLHDIGTAASTGAQAVGVGLNSLGLPGQETANNVASSLQGITPNEPASPQPSPIADLRAGQYGQALTDTAHRALRGVVGSAPIFAGEALGGPVGAAAGAGLEALGPTAAARAQANNRPMTGADVAAAIPGAAAQGLAGAMLPGAGLPAKLANPLLRAGARAGMGAAGMGGMALTGQVANTLGTDKGLQVNPEEIGNAALTGAAMGGTAGGAELAREGVKNVADKAMARSMPMPDTETAKSVYRVTNDMQAVQQQRAAAGQPIAPTVAANAVKDMRLDALKQFTAGLLAGQLIDKPDYLQLGNTIDAALRANNTISKSQLDHIDSLGLEPAQSAFLKDNLTDLNTASSQSFKNREVGPFQKVGNVVGQVGSIGAALASHNPALIIGAALGHRAEGAIGGRVGMMADRLMGTNTPPILLQRINALKALQAAGIDPHGLGMGAMPELPQAPGRVGPTPGFIRPMGGPQVMNPPAPEPPSGGPVPPFIRPRPQMPTPQPGQPDPVTGLPPSPVPPNTPLPANYPVPPKAPSLPAFQPDTAQTVASTIAADKMAQPPSTVPLSGAMAYLKNGLPGMTPEQITAALQAHETAGRLPQGTVADLQTAPKVPPAMGAKLQQLAAGLAAQRQYAVDVSEQARVNAREYQNNARAYAAMHPEIADAVLQIAQAAKTPEAKRALAQAYVATHPEALGKFPEWLLNHGQRS